MKLFLLFSDIYNMKVKVLTRRPEDFVRETKSDIHKVHRNYRLFDNMFIHTLFGNGGVCVQIWSLNLLVLSLRYWDETLIFGSDRNSFQLGVFWLNAYLSKDFLCYYVCFEYS